MRDELKSVIESALKSIGEMTPEERMEAKQKAAERAGITPEKMEEFRLLQRSFTEVATNEVEIPDLIGCSDEALRLFQTWLEMQDVGQVVTDEPFALGVFIGIATGLEVAKRRG